MCGDIRFYTGITFPGSDTRVIFYGYCTNRVVTRGRRMFLYGYYTSRVAHVGCVILYTDITLTGWAFLWGHKFLDITLIGWVLGQGAYVSIRVLNFQDRVPGRARNFSYGYYTHKVVTRTASYVSIRVLHFQGGTPVRGGCVYTSFDTEIDCTKLQHTHQLVCIGFCNILFFVVTLIQKCSLRSFNYSCNVYTICYC